MPNKEPLTHLGPAGVCARVALRLVARSYRLDDGFGITPTEALSAAQMSLPADGYPIVHSAILSLALAVARGEDSRVWLAHVLYRDLLGMDWRRCLAPYYKATRRRPPYY